MYLAAVRDGRQPNVAAPYAYILHVWRRKFSIGWLEAFLTPAWVVEQDWEIFALQREYSQDNNSQATQDPTKGPRIVK